MILDSNKQFSNTLVVLLFNNYPGVPLNLIKKSMEINNIFLNHIDIIYQNKANLLINK